MKRLHEILKLNPEDLLLKKLQRAGFSFAMWKMPEKRTIQFIVSLKKTSKAENFQLLNMHTGFLINEYADNHPIRPYHISADIIMEDDQVYINPKVQSSEIDRFIKQIYDTPDSIQTKLKKTTNTCLDSFENSVRQAISNIKDHVFEKVVLSRFEDDMIPSNFSIWEFFQIICSKYQNNFCSISHIPGKGIWVGATPELLLSENGNQFKTVSLAGTKELNKGHLLSKIAWTQKEIEEQALVSRYIINCFKKIRLREFHEYGPKTIQSGNLAHLKTEFIVDHEEVGFYDLANQMVELLHPTSAVCGMPIEYSRPWITEVEKYDREFYAGFLGPVNFENSTNLFVNLRCMKLHEDKIRFYAGAGITEDSIPKNEYLETKMKMNVLRSIIQS